MTTLSVIFIVSGLFFFAVGTVGLLRLPDFYSRMHATGKCDTLGLGLVLTGLVFHEGLNINSIKIILIIIFIFIANPTATHSIARAGLKNKIKEWRRK